MTGRGMGVGVGGGGLGGFGGGWAGNEDVPLVEVMYLVFTCMPGESCRR